VLVLHGWLEQGAAWDAVAQRLGREVWAPDQRGHGLSEHVGRGGWYHFWDYVGDAAALADAMGPPVDVVGHSMGGAVACLLAATRPDVVRRLVLVEGLGPPDGTDGAVQRAREYVAERLAPPRHGTLASIDDAADRLRRTAPRLSPETARRLASRVTRPAAPGDGPPGALVWTWDALHRARAPVPFLASLFATFLREIRAPVLRVDGADSAFVLPDADARAALLDIRRYARIDGAGHLVHHDQPEALAEAIRAFLDAP
jgi:pimeloyl-ACP methyl ester carboxylesterase